MKTYAHFNDAMPTEWKILC